MKKNALKLLVGINIFIFILLPTLPTLYAQTLGDLQSDYDKSVAEYEQLQSDLANTQYTIDYYINEINRMDQEIRENEAEMLQIEEDIEVINKEIPIYYQQAEASLVYLQYTMHSNYMVELLASDDMDSQDIIRSLNASTKLTDAAINSVNELIRLENELLQKEQELVDRQVYLEAQIAYMNEAIYYMELAAAEMEQESYNQEAAIKAQEDLIKLYEDAGCGPNDVYGIDCGNLVAATGFQSPIRSGVVTSEFGQRGNNFHTGIDLANSSGTPVYPAADGIVISTFYDSSGGNQVLVLHLVDGQNYVTNYAHLSGINVSEGQQVTTNTQLGTMGQTGTATGPHLHFEINKGSQWAWAIGQPELFENPRNYIYWPSTGVWF